MHDHYEADLVAHNELLSRAALSALAIVGWLIIFGLSWTRFVSYLLAGAGRPPMISMATLWSCLNASASSVKVT
jgi:hypothetical protein